MKHKPDIRTILPLSERYFIWGIIFFVTSLTVSLSAYYLYSPIGRQFAFSLLIFSLMILFWAMAKDLESIFTYKWGAKGIILALISVYFLQRMELPRFDFSVGDPSDYFIAGICSVTYNQDIGFFMPLTASITALGYEVLGIEYTPLINVIVYAVSIPLSYFIFKKLISSLILSLIMSTFLTFIPVSIIFSKTSFTEPTWQTLLIIFSINAYYLLLNKKLAWKNIVIFYLILFLAPFLRGEGVVYYGLILFLIFYHYWKFADIKSVLWLAIGTAILAGTVHLSLSVRSNYLLNMQFSRIIPHISEFQLMSILYGITGLTFFMILLTYLLKNKYKVLPLPLILVGLSIFFKVGVSSIYAAKKHTSIMHLLFINEYNLAVGNFGLLITLFMIMGLILLYTRAIKGENLPLMLVILYSLFHLSYVMQAVTFYDVHAMFMYWNRYYLSVFMIVNLFALGIALQFIYQNMKKWIDNQYFRSGIFSIFLGLLVFFSMNGRMYQIAVTEAHHKDSYKFFEWVKEKVQKEPFTVVLDSSIIYKQNKEHIGLNDLKYMISRTFSIYKMNVRKYQRVKPKKLNSKLKYDVDLSKIRYVLCIGDKDYHLENKTLTKIEQFKLPLIWRENFGLEKNASSIHHGDITKSIIKHIDLHATLYSVNEKLIVGKKITFKKNKSITKNILKEGWTFINNRSNAFSSEGKGIICIPKIQKLKEQTYSLIVRYAIINAKSNQEKNVTFKLAGKVLKTVKVNSHTTRELELILPNALLPSKLGNIEITMESSDAGQIMLRSIMIHKKVTLYR